MYKDLFINLALLISFLSIGGQLFRKRPIHSSIKNKLLAGILSGVFGAALMLFSVTISETMIIDLRNFSIIIATFCGGWISGLAAGIITAFFRIAFFGLSASSIAAVVIMFFLVLTSGLAINLKISRFNKFFVMNLFNIIGVFTAMTYLMKDQAVLIDLLIFYGSISLVGGFIVFVIIQYISQANEDYRRLREQASKDFLTGLNNVRMFDETWNKQVLKALETSRPLSLLVIDIDHFKNVNDRYGHPIGDMILKGLSEILRKTEESGAIISRNGGEEFTVILPDFSRDAAFLMAESIRKEVQNHSFLISEKKSLQITISIGIASYPETSSNLESLIKEADMGLYQAKNTGRNKVCDYNNKEPKKRLMVGLQN